LFCIPNCFTWQRNCKAIFHLHYYSFYLSDTEPLKLEVTKKKKRKEKQSSILKKIETMYLFDPRKLLSFGNVTDACQIQQVKQKQFTFHILLNGHFSASGKDCIFPRLDESVGLRSSSGFQRLGRCARMSKKTQKQLFLKKFGRFFLRPYPSNLFVNFGKIFLEYFLYCLTSKNQVTNT